MIRAARAYCRHSVDDHLDTGVVHALSNHLLVILGFVEILIADTQPDHPRRRDLLEIRDAAMAAAVLIGRGPVNTPTPNTPISKE